MIETKFFPELLMRLFAHPSGPDGSPEPWTKRTLSLFVHDDGCIDEARKIGFEMRHCYIEDDFGGLTRSRQVNADYGIPNDRHVKARISAVSDCAVHKETGNRPGDNQIGDAFPALAPQTAPEM